jgi:hypothetical protein
MSFQIGSDLDDFLKSNKLDIVEGLKEIIINDKIELNELLELAENENDLR